MRLLLALWIGKIIFSLTRLTKHGGGSAGPGYYALKIYPELVEKLAKQIPQNIVITGTNGKTTTARLLSHFISDQQKVIRNTTGSNLKRGIASTLIAAASWTGKIEADLGIWELDEAAFNTVIFELKPVMIVFLNAFRDQLDRYGEVDSVIKKWWESLKRIDWEATIIINKSDANVGPLVAIEKENTNLNALTFSVKNHYIYHEVAFDAKKEIKLFKSDFEAENYKSLGLKGTEFTLNYPSGKEKYTLHIPGIYHIYDFLAALSVYYQLNLPIDTIQEKLETFSPAFGRVEEIKLGNQTAYIFLIKNPAGTNQVLETLAPEIKPNDRLLIALNDNFADGKDISWIWDAEFEKIVEAAQKVQIFCSGKRAQDLTLRLKYAGMDSKQLITENDLNNSLQAAQKGLYGKLFILPTYTALLELQNILAKTGIKKHYWKES